MTMDYLAMLEHSHAMECELFGSERKRTRLEFLSGWIFDFTTYDGDMDTIFARRAIEVCRAISDGTTFAFIEDPERYQWYLIMCNMPFFANRLEWGTSIRGAWWDTPAGGIKLNSCGLWVGREQLLDLTFNEDEWVAFIAALIAFAAPEMAVTT